MSGNMYGADADELDRLAAEFMRAADELDRDGGALTGVLNNISWLGDAAGRFLGDWTGVQLPKIGLSTRFLRDTAAALSRNAAQQRSASGGGTRGAGARMVHGGWGTDEASNWRFGDPVGPAVPWGWAGNLTTSLAPLLDGVGAGISADEFRRLWLGSLSAGFHVLENLADEHGLHGVSLIAGGAARVADIRVAVLDATAAPGASKLVPAFAIVGGTLGFIDEYNESFSSGFDAGSGLKMSGSAITTVGGIAMLLPIPGARFVGGGLLIAGATVQGVGWVVDNWSQIGDGVTAVTKAAGRVASDTVEAVGDAVGEVAGAVDDAVDRAADVIAGGFERIGSLF